MVLLIVGQVLGVFIVINGLSTLDAGGTEPAVFGAAGVMKVPHAVVLHAIQALPLLAWLFLFTGWSERGRTRAVIAACAGYAGLVAASAMQTFSGLAPFDPGLSAALVLAVCSVFLLAGSYALGLFALLRPPARVSGAQIQRRTRALKRRYSSPNSRSR